MLTLRSWYNPLIARFALGFAVGAKSSTTLVYAAECSPTPIRGALAMQWQMWTAFGIMLGFIVSVAFQDVSTATIPFLNWRLMLGSTGIPPLVVTVQVYFCPESPRWYMTKNKYDKAFKSLCRFRPSRLQAARDVYYIHKSLVLEDKMREGKNLFKDFFRIKRNRKAAQSSFSVMFMQQVCRDLLRAEYGELTSLKFCGVNVIAYYSTQIFIDAEFSRSTALVVSLGTGIVNWLFAIPAFYTIDTFGRRNLLLTTFPLMGLFLLFTGFSFFIPDLDARPACVATGMYLFMVVYSPGEGPVPFTCKSQSCKLLGAVKLTPILRLRRGLPAIHTRVRHGLRNSNNVVLQLHPHIHMACARRGLHSTGSIWLVCRLELHRLDPLLLLPSRDEGT